MGVDQDMRKDIHPNCVVCSTDNPRGLKLKFAGGNSGSVVASFNFGDCFEGYPGMVHGGVISSVMDGAMAHCMFSNGNTAVTVELSMKFRHPLLTHSEASVEAKIVRTAHPLYLLEAKIRQDGIVKVISKGKFFDQPKLKGQPNREIA